MAKKKTPQQPPSTRTVAEIQQEYANVCAAMGDKIMKIRFLDSEIVQLQAKCQQLNSEVLTLPQEAPSGQSANSSQ